LELGKQWKLVIILIIKTINELFVLCQFSDGVTTVKKSLFNIIQDWIDPKYTDEDVKSAEMKYKHCPPNSKESLYYRYCLSDVIRIIIHVYIFRIILKVKGIPIEGWWNNASF